MSQKSCKLYPIILVVMAMFLGSFLIAPVSYAGGAADIVPADDIELPAGSFIPEERMKKIETKVKDLKAKEKAEAQQQDQTLQNESIEPDNPKE